MRMRKTVHDSNPTMDDEALRVCLEAFKFADEGEKGYLSREDYKVAVIALLGYKPSRTEVDALWRRGQGLTADKFTQVMLPRLRGRERGQVVRDVFLAFDSCCHGFLTVSECYAAFRTVIPHMREEQVEALFREVDRDMDGRVSYRDFELMMLHFTLTQ